MKKQERMWGGRFSGGPAAEAEAYSRSLHFDCRLAPYDISVSRANARALRKAGILNERELRTLLTGLASLEKQISSGKADFTTGEEDIHTWIENRLRSRVGAAADKLHTGRSRNDQVAQDLRLYLTDVIDATLAGLRALKTALLDQAEANMGLITAGHTHLQPAQPVLLSHHLLAYFEMFQRDTERLVQLRPRTAVLTLGSGALAGTGIRLDRRLLARELGLKALSLNSMDAVSDRDFVAEYLFVASLVMVHLSRLSEELILWAHPSLGWVDLPEAYCTGSSLMPQKRNPDMAELARGKAGRVIGRLSGLLATLKGLPLTYNRDLQEDKEPLFDSADTVLGSLSVIAPMLKGLSFNEERLAAAAGTGFSFATDLAEFLAARGVPFRKAHGAVGSLVRMCIDEGKEPRDLTLAELKRFSSAFTAGALTLIAPDKSVRMKDLPGGTAPARVNAALKKARKRNS